MITACVTSCHVRQPRRKPHQRRPLKYMRGRRKGVCSLGPSWPPPFLLRCVAFIDGDGACSCFESPVHASVAMQQFFVSLLAPALLARSSVAAPSNWDTAYTQAQAALEKLSRSEKVGIVTGVTWEGGPCVGNTYAPNAIDYPSLCLQDGPLGIRFANPVTAFPAGINAGATWDRGLMHARGVAMGAEAKGLGIHVQLGPATGPLGKNPDGGRNWEGFSVDPYLTGVGMEETILGMQESGVQACAKVCAAV